MPARKPAGGKSTKSASKGNSKKSATKKSASKKAGSKRGATKKTGSRKSSRKQSTGLLSKAKEALKAVFTSAAAGAAEGAIAGAAEETEKISGNVADKANEEKASGTAAPGSKRAAKK
jgi:hypothetical protein